MAGADRGRIDALDPCVVWATRPVRRLPMKVTKSGIMTDGIYVIAVRAISRVPWAGAVFDDAEVSMVGGTRVPWLAGNRPPRG